MRYKIYTLCVCFICLNSDCSSEERLIVKDISKPLIINTTTEISNDNNCLSLIKDYKLEFTDEKKQYFIDDPVAFYSSIKDILVKGTKLEIMFEQRKEILQYESLIQLRIPIVKDMDEMSEQDSEVAKDCESWLKEKKEINFESKKTTGKSGWAKNNHPEQFLILGFEKPIEVSSNNKNWQPNGSISIDLESEIKKSKKTNSIIELIIKCISCKNTKSDSNYPKGLELPILSKKIFADFRFIKNQM